MALRDQPYLPLYVQDFLTDEKLSCCSLSSQGVYIRILCALHKSDTYGGILFKQIPSMLYKQNTDNQLKQNLSSLEYFVFVLARQIGVERKEVAEALNELLFFGVLKIDKKDGVDFLYQKRMVVDFDRSLKRSKAAKKGGGNPALAKTKSDNDAENLFKQIDKQNTEIEIEYQYIDNNTENKEVSNFKNYEKKPIADLKKEYLTDKYRGSRDAVGMKLRIHPDQVNKILDAFVLHLKSNMEEEKSMPDFVSHFTNWTNKIDTTKILQEKKPEYVPVIDNSLPNANDLIIARLQGLVDSCKKRNKPDLVEKYTNKLEEAKKMYNRV